MIKKLEFYFDKYFYTIYGFLIGIILLFLIIASIDKFITNIITTFNFRCIVYLILYIIWFLFWYILKEYYPSNTINKVGIIIAIVTENDKQKNKILNDLILNMKDVIAHNNLTDLINIINLEDYKGVKAREILQLIYLKTKECGNNIEALTNTKEFKRYSYLLKKTKGHFYIWGSIKERMDSENKYYLSLNTLVRHRALNYNLSKIISSEIQSVFLNDISFYEKLEVKGVHFVCDVFMFASRYIIGIASLLSGDPYIAYKIHNNLHSEMNTYLKKYPNLNKISERLNHLLCEELLLQVKIAYTFENNYNEALRLLRKAEGYVNSDYNILIFKSYLSFDHDKNPNQSLIYCHQAKDLAKGSATWLYNQAFLYMYIEDFVMGFNDYNTLKDNNYIDEDLTLDECIIYNNNYLLKHTDYYQSYFILGYLYYFKKSNLPLALDNFELFLKHASNINKFNFLCEQASIYIAEIKVVLKLT